MLTITQDLQASNLAIAQQHNYQRSFFLKRYPKPHRSFMDLTDELSQIKRLCLQNQQDMTMIMDRSFAFDCRQCRQYLTD